MLLYSALQMYYCKVYAAVLNMLIIILYFYICLSTSATSLIKIIYF